MVFHDTFFVDNWKVWEVEKALSSFYKKWNHKVFLQRVQSFNISLNKRVKELSSGMKMKLMLAVALFHEAKLLILDEPTSGLDPVAREGLLDILLRYIEDEKTVYFSQLISQQT